MVIDHHLGSWDDFVRIVESGLSYGEALPPSCIFRGQSDSRWPLETTLDRAGQRDMSFADYYRMILRARPQIETLTKTHFDNVFTYNTVQEMLGNYDEFSLAMSSGNMPGYSYMLFLRHHGFPSPILDWTRSPYVAAYFAFATQPPGAMECVIHALEFASMQMRGTGTVEFYKLGPYVRTDERHFRQQCEYTVCMTGGNGWRFRSHADAVVDDVTLSPEIASRFQHRLWKFYLPLSERERALNFLDRFNLNAYSLFGSTDSLVSTLAERELRAMAASQPRENG